MPKQAVTIEDVAREAGVSRTTAIFALNNSQRVRLADETRQRVHEVAGRLGYRRNGLASALRRGRSGAIGIIVYIPPERGVPRGPHITGTAAVMAIIQVAARHGLRVTLLPFSREHAVELNEALDQRVDGLVLISLDSDHGRELARGIYGSGFPCVSLGSGYAERRIMADNCGGAAQAVEHLIALGHRKIRYVGDDRSPRLSGEQRIEGVRSALERHGIPFASENLCIPLGDMEAVLRLPREERPTAVMCFNDWVASEVLNIARSQGLRLPDDLSVVGFDDSVLAEACYPRLTTVYASMEEQAEAALQVLEALWRKEAPVIGPNIPTRLVVRDSTAPPGL